MVHVLYFDEYGSHNVRDTFNPFHHIYIIGNVMIGGSEMLWNSCDHIMEYDFIQGTVNSVSETWCGTSTLFQQIWIT